MQNFEDSRTWGVYSSILSEEGIDFIYSKKAHTAYFDLENRKVVVPIWEWMDNYAKQLLVSHEVGHAKFSDYTIKAFNEYTEKFKDLFNIVEDARIERLMKKEYAGLNNIFTKGYSLLIKNNIFEIPDDLNECNFIERLNLYAKIGTVIDVPFNNEEEYKFSYRIMNLNTKADVIALCCDIYDYLKEHNENMESNLGSPSSNVMVDADDENAMPGKRMKVKDIDKNADESDNGNQGMKKDEEDADKKDGKSSVNGKEDENKKSNPDKKDGTGDSDKNIDDKLTDRISKRLNDNIEKKDAENKANKSGNEDKHLRYSNFLAAIDTKEYSDIFFNFAYKIAPVLAPTLTNKFYRRMDTMIKNLAKSASNLFKQKMSANENAMMRNRTVGKLDMKKIAKFATSENIFRNVKMLPKGKNHAIVILLDYSSSMSNNHQLMGEFIQACVFGEFCRINNIPFSIYAYGAAIIYGMKYIGNGATKSRYFYKKDVEKNIRNGVMLIGDNFNFSIPAIMWLANKRGYTHEFTESSTELKNGYVAEKHFYVSQNSTPTLEALTFAYRKLKNYKNNGIEKTFLYIMTDGSYNTTMKCKQFIDYNNNSVWHSEYPISYVNNLVIDNKQYSIKDYEKYFSGKYRNEAKDSMEEILDWTFELFLGHIKKELGTTIVYSYVDSGHHVIACVPKICIESVYSNLRCNYSGRSTLYNALYFYKHFMFFESDKCKYEDSATFTYNFKNNPFIDQYLFLNTDIIRDLNIDKKYTVEKVKLDTDNEDDMGNYLKNNNSIIKIFDVLVRSFINIFS